MGGWQASALSNTSLAVTVVRRLSALAVGLDKGAGAGLDGADTDFGKGFELDNFDEPFFTEFEDGQKRDNNSSPSFFSDKTLREKEAIFAFKVCQNGCHSFTD